MLPRGGVDVASAKGWWKGVVEHGGVCNKLYIRRIEDY